MLRLVILCCISMAAACAAQPQGDSQSPGVSNSNAVTEATPPFQELVYSVHSKRLSRTAPTAACFGTPFPTVVEDTFALYTTESRASDGQIVNFSVREVGSLIACFGLTSNPDVLNFYAPSMDIDGISATGIGECDYVLRNTPATNSHYLRCYLKLTVPGFSGGFFANNSSTGTEIVQSDVSQFGTHEASFAIIRLWRPNQ